MGLFDALTTAVSGLQAQSFAMQNISGNIANSQTTAYKGIDTNFADLIPGDSVPTHQIAGGVIANSRATNNVQGTIQSTTSTTDMAVNGNGYFIVQAPTSFNGNQPLFGGIDSYTRRGDFQFDATGIWSMARDISSKASRLTQRPAIRSVASLHRCNSRAIFCPQAPQPQSAMGSIFRQSRRRTPLSRRHRIPNSSIRSTSAPIRPPSRNRNCRRQ